MVGRRFVLESVCIIFLLSRLKSWCGGLGERWRAFLALVSYSSVSDCSRPSSLVTLIVT
jgi:hypothetical protein